MVVFPNAKINLGLNILSKREDGYHNISSVFYPIPLEDILEILPSNEFGFQITGTDIPGKSDQNLAVRAYQLLKKEFTLPPVQIHLHKVIPMGAGLGGGSSDAAFAISCLNDLFELGLSTDLMEGYAAQLGSDCPFFIRNAPVLAEGTGNIFTDISLSLNGKYLVLVSPSVHVSTAEAYSTVVPKLPDFDIKEVLSFPVNEWKDKLVNDFETSVFRLYPEIEQVKDQLYAAGALYASMSGSGSSIFGIFEQEPERSFENISWKGSL